MSESVSQCVNKGMNEYHLRLEFLRESNGWPSLKAATPFILDFPSLSGSYIPISDICGNDFSDHLTAVLPNAIFAFTFKGFSVRIDVFTILR